MRNAQSGFTLIEIMVVVVILAVLGALVVPKILENVDKARVTRAQSDIRAIQTALDLYRLDNFKYPTTELGLQALVKQPADPTITNYRSGGYLGSLPKDPWNNPYQYVSPGPDGRDYDIITYGQARGRRLRRGHQQHDSRSAIVAALGCAAACAARASRWSRFWWWS
jgi:general secretion pathway protein G